MPTGPDWSSMENMIEEIRVYGDPVLRKTAEEITEITDEIRDLNERMIETMLEDDKGIGLAAPQVGVSKRMVVIDRSFGDEESDILTMINPEIIETEGEITFEEGCLSVPDIYESVTRPKRVKATYTDIDGNQQVIDNDDFLARVIQHEIDHLNGVLFVDRLNPVKRALLSKKLRTLAKESKKA